MFVLPNQRLCQVRHNHFDRLEVPRSRDQLRPIVAETKQGKDRIARICGFKLSAPCNRLAQRGYGVFLVRVAELCSSFEP
jgi:hypothetical protein